LIKLSGRASVLKTIQFSIFTIHSKITAVKSAKGGKKLIAKRKIPKTNTRVDSEQQEDWKSKSKWETGGNKGVQARRGSLGSYGDAGKFAKSNRHPVFNLP